MISICNLNKTISRTNTNPKKTFDIFIDHFLKTKDKFSIVKV